MRQHRHPTAPGHATHIGDSGCEPGYDFDPRGTGQHKIPQAHQYQPAAPTHDHHISLEALAKNWLVGYLIRGIFVILVFVGGFAVKSTLNGIDSKLSELTSSAHSVDDRVRVLELKDAALQQYIKVLSEWQRDMNSWKATREAIHQPRKD